MHNIILEALKATFQTMLVALVFILTAIFQQVEALSLQNYIDDALKNSPILKSQAHKTKAKESEAQSESTFQKNPVFSLAHSNSPLSSWPSLNSHAMSGVEASLAQTFTFPWESVYRKRTRYKLFLSQKQMENEVKATLLLHIKQTYHALYFLYRKEQLLIENRQSLTEIVTQARALVSVDKMSASQLLKLEADLAILDNDITQNRAELAKVQAKIEELSGVSYEWVKAPSDIDEWQAKSTAVAIPEKFDAKKHPLYKAVSFSVQAAEANFAHAKGNLFPDVTVGASYRFRQEVTGKDSGEDFFSLKASTSIPLYYAVKERHDIEAKKQTLLTMKQEQANIDLKLTKGWQGEFGQAGQLKESYIKYETSVLPRYLASFKAQRGALSAGTVSLLDVLDSYRRYLMVSIQSAKTYKDLQQSISYLEYLQTTANLKEDGDD
ncbi:MAG: TolC family protein [Leptospiraceae bacterium]|nr:TolC family protein [Leptospiraceae bacterium]